MTLRSYSNRQVIAEEYATRIPAERLRRIIAEQAGDLLTEALLNSPVDTDKPIFLTPAHHSDFRTNCIVVEIGLLVHEREPERPAIEEALPGARELLEHVANELRSLD